MENETQVQQLTSIPSVVPEEAKSNVSLEIKPVEQLKSTKQEAKPLSPPPPLDEPQEVTKEDIFIRPNSKKPAQNLAKKAKKKRVISERQRAHLEKMRRLKSEKRAANKIPPAPKNPPKLERSPAVIKEKEEQPVVTMNRQNKIDPDLGFFDKVERMFTVMHKYESMRNNRQVRQVRQPNTSHQAAQPAVQRSSKPSQAKRSVPRPKPETLNFVSNYQSSFKNPFGF